MGEKRNRIGALDFETDPFLAGRVPYPFAVCIYFADDDFAMLWDTDSKQDFLTRVVRALRRLPPCILYAHNGGKFDFHYLVEDAEKGHIQIRNGRIVQMKIGNVLLKDSFPLMPFALEEYRKTPINYAIFERRFRNKPANRKRIADYLLDDCRNLLELVTGFREIVGPKDTIGSAAFFQMREYGIKIRSMSETHDAMFRPFYFGGRVQAFDKGLFRGPLDYVDINSAYPRAMLEDHPHGADYRHSARLPRTMHGAIFVRLLARSRGAFPVRNLHGALSFPADDLCREYHVTGWELIAALETGTADIVKVLDVWTPHERITFRDYVRHFYGLRLKAKKEKDAIRALAYKYLLNAGYGKFAQNPRDFKEYVLAAYGKPVKGYEWVSDFGAVSIWQRGNFRGWGFFDVCTGASITGYVRAMLWRAICASRGVVYADTDAIICKRAVVPLGDDLGQWKLEGTVKTAAIAGKKLYGVEWARPKDGIRFKVATKGARLEWRDLLDLCNGKSIIWNNDAPTFSISGASFISRKISAT